MKEMQPTDQLEVRQANPITVGGRIPLRVRLLSMEWPIMRIHMENPVVGYVKLTSCENMLMHVTSVRNSHEVEAEVFDQSFTNHVIFDRLKARTLGEAR